MKSAAHTASHGEDCPVCENRRELKRLAEGMEPYTPSAASPSPDDPMIGGSDVPLSQTPTPDTRAGALGDSGAHEGARVPGGRSDGRADRGGRQEALGGGSGCVDDGGSGGRGVAAGLRSDALASSAATIGGAEHFDWALCDPDAPVGTTYREGVGFYSLVEALRDLCSVEAERTPEQFIPSGNVSLYWSRKVRDV